MHQRTKIAIGLGSNLSDRLKVLKQAADILVEEFLEDAESSSVYETAPWGFLEQPPFYNAVITGYCDWKPPGLVNYFQRLEERLGRKPGPRLGPRVLDLDLIAYDDKTWESDGVKVPHASLEEREFVLLPLCEIWPDWRHPVLGRTAQALLTDLLKTQPSGATKIAPPLLNKVIPSPG